MNPTPVKRRKCVFGVEEQLKLLELIEKEKEIIENKVTDKVANDEKDLAWNRIATAYNAVASEYRTTDQLKSKYDNLKTKARKAASDRRCSYTGTGGGKPRPDLDPILELVLSLINIKTVVGETNVFDDDDHCSFYFVDIHVITVMNQCTWNIYLVASKLKFLSYKNDLGVPEEGMPKSIEAFTNNVSIIVEAPHEGNPNIDLGNLNEFISLSVDEKSNESKHKNEASCSYEVQASSKNYWGKYTPEKLKMPKSKKLHPIKRNVIKPLQEQLYAKKIEYLDGEIKARKEEERRREEEHERKMKLLDLEIQLKEEEIKKNVSF